MDLERRTCGQAEGLKAASVPLEEVECTTRGVDRQLASVQFPYAVLSCVDRDYAFLHDCRDLLDAPVVITTPEHNTSGGSRPSRNHAALDEMRHDSRFALLSGLQEDLYLKLVLHARVIIVPVLGEMAADCTSIADAIWYGNPVLTNRVKANAHLGDRVIFFDGKEELREWLRDLMLTLHSEL